MSENSVDPETLKLIINGMQSTISAEMKGIKDVMSAEIKGFKSTISSDFSGFKNLVAERDRSYCKQIEKVERDKIQHDKRISNIEKTVAYNVGKIIGISSFVGGIITFIGIMLK